MVCVRDVEYPSADLRIRGERRDPDGEPRGVVVLLHGAGQTRSSWTATAERLAGQGWRTVALDMRGHGASDWSDTGAYSLEVLVEDVRAACAGSRGPDGDPPVLIGASLGGIVSMIATGADAELARALVLVDIAPRIEADGADRVITFMKAHTGGFDSLPDVHRALLAYNPGRPRPFDPAGLQRTVRRRSDGRWYWHWDPALITVLVGQLDREDVERELARAAATIAVPTMLVRGRSSDVLSEEGARELAAILPDTHFVDVSAGHMVAGDDNDVFTTEVAKFLDTLAP